MSIFKNATKEDIQVLQQLEKELKAKERREKIEKWVLGGMAFLTVCAYVAGRFCRKA